MKKRLIYLTCMTLTAMLLFAACGEGGGGGATGPVGEVVSADTGAGVDAVAGEVGLEHITLSIAGSSGIAGIIETWEPENDIIAAYMAERFNVTFEPVIIEGTDALRLRGIAGDLPDVFNTWFDIRLVNEWIDQGIIRSIPDEIVARYPTIHHGMTVDPFTMASRELYGAYYFVPQFFGRDIHSPRANQAGQFIRVDWLENLGLDMPTNLDEFYYVLYAFTHGDPAGDGSNVVGYTANGLSFFIQLLPNFNTISTAWLYEDGQWIPWYMSDNIVYAVEWLQRMYRSGVIDPEIQENNWTQALQKFSGGMAGVVGRNADTGWVHQVFNIFSEANPGVDPFDKVAVIPPMSRNAQTQPKLNMNRTGGGMLFDAGTSDAQLDRYMMIHDWMLSDEGTILLNLGFEGVHYTVDSDGGFTLLDDPATGLPFNIGEMYNAVAIRSNAHWGFCVEIDTAFPHASISDEIRLYSQQLLADRDRYAQMFDLRMVLMTTPAVDNLVFSSGDEFSAMMRSPYDPETTFAIFRDRMIAMGVEDAIREANEFAQAHGITP